MPKNSELRPSTKLADPDQRQAFIEVQRPELRKEVKEAQELFKDIKISRAQCLLGVHEKDPTLYNLGDRSRPRKAISFGFPKDLLDAETKYKSLLSIFVPGHRLAMELSTKDEGKPIRMLSSVLDCITSPEGNEDIMNFKQTAEFVTNKDIFERVAFAYALHEILQEYDDLSYASHIRFSREGEKQKILDFLEANLSEEFKVLQDLKLEEAVQIGGQASGAYGGRYTR